MDAYTINGIKELTKTLKGKTQDNPNFRFEDSLGIVLMNLVARKLAGNYGIHYLDAVRIATSMNVDTEILVEEDDSIQVIDDLAGLFAKFIVETSISMFDDKTLDAQVMQNFASKMTFKV
jgi:hypothetical protein